MRALYFDKVGSLDNLRVQELPEPSPGDGEVLIKVAAAAINPSDVKNVLGKMPMTSIPRVPGRDFVGQVIAGKSEWEHTVVFGTGGDLGFRRDGSHAEYVTVPAEAVVELPPDLNYVDATASSLGYLTADTALRRLTDDWHGTTLLVTGATGAVGSTAVRIALSQGAHVFGTIRSQKDLADRSDLPDIEWIDLSAAPLSDSVRQLTNDRGVESIVDAVGGPLFEQCLASLAQRGRQACLTSVGDPRVTFNLVDFYHREATLTGIDTLRLSFREAAEAMRSFLTGLQQGLFTPPPAGEITLDDAPDAYRAIEAGTAAKKLVIKFDGATP